MQNPMKITLEFPGASVEEAMAGVRAFAEAWANVYANAGLPDMEPGDLIQSVVPLSTPFLEAQLKAMREKRYAVAEATEEESVGKAASFLDEVEKLEQREDLKPAEQGPGPTRADVEAAFRRMVAKQSSEAAALAAGRAVLKILGAASVPAIPEDKFVECLQLLKELNCDH